MSDDGRYSQGICGDAAMILYDGVPVTVDDIVARLNLSEEREERVGLSRARIRALESRIKELTAYAAGPWRAWQNPPTDSRVCVGTEDLTHDTILYVSGDFATDEKKREAAMRIATILNKAEMERG